MKFAISNGKLSETSKTMETFTSIWIIWITCERIKKQTRSVDPRAREHIHLLRHKLREKDHLMVLQGFYIRYLLAYNFDRAFSEKKLFITHIAVPFTLSLDLCDFSHTCAHRAYIIVMVRRGARRIARILNQSIHFICHISTAIRFNPIHTYYYVVIFY